MIINEETKERLSIAGTIITLITGILTINSNPLWLSLPCFALTIILIIYLFVTKKRTNDFKILWQEITLFLLDEHGNKSTFKNDSVLKALRNNVQKFRYNLYSDGVLSGFSVTNGRIMEIVQESGKTKIETLLEAPQKNGSEVRNCLSCNIEKAFTNNLEYWETTKYTPGTSIRLQIIFPSNRIFKEYKAFEVIGAKKILAQKQPYVSTINNQPALVFEIKQARLLESYRIEWYW